MWCVDDVQPEVSAEEMITDTSSRGSSSDQDDGGTVEHFGHWDTFINIYSIG